ncbi:MAG TPA: NAD(P)-dependent oxidoreductase [Lacunisphaera sp.]
MKIAIIGATGQVGSQLTTEALSRGHNISGIARSPDSLPTHERLKPVKADLTDSARLPQILMGHGAVFVAVKFAGLDGEKLIAAIESSGVKRFLVVGGAGSLEIAPGKRLVDQSTFPTEYKAEALAAGSFLKLLRRETGLDWTFLSPSAYLHAGPRTGKFRLGHDTLLVDTKGESHISIADYAIAFLDELERPQYPRSRFTVGY